MINVLCNVDIYTGALGLHHALTGPAGRCFSETAESSMQTILIAFQGVCLEAFVLCPDGTQDLFNCYPASFESVPVIAI